MTTIKPSDFPGDNPELLAELRVPPVVSWPAVIIMVVAFAMIISSWTFCLMEEWPLWVGMIVNSIAGYMLFTPTHDAIHRAASRHEWLNELILRISTFIAVPFGKGKLFRLYHMRHHRFTNEPEQDPDHLLSCSLKLMPLWGIWPFLYIVYFAKDPKLTPGLKPAELIRELVIGFGFVGVVAVFLPMQMLWLWLLPVYISFFLMCLVFMVLPHYPHAVPESENPWHASLMRLGGEWFLTPVLMYQNYHLMHHLYPTVPFYRYGKAWRSRQQYHLANNPGIVPALGLGAKNASQPQEA